MKKIFSFIGSIFNLTWKLLIISSSLVTNLFFLIILILVASVFVEPEIKVPDNAALVMALKGELVEKKTVIDPVSKIINGYAGFPLTEEILLQDVLDATETAAGDERITLMVLNLDELESASLNQLQTIGQSLESFRRSGKKIIVLGDDFNQGHYYLASFADEIYLNPMGGVGLRGFGLFRMYMKELSDRLAINFHVFKVGAFKSAMEPFTRDNMSPEAREANQEWLGRLWRLFCAEISANRGLPEGFIDSYINHISRYLERSGGSSSAAALDNNLVDGVMTRGEAEQYLIEQTGKDDDGKSFRQIHFADYLSSITPSYKDQDYGKNSIGIIVARGNILYGEDVPGQIGSNEITRLIRDAREDNKIKAVVLRVDSGGGSAFASELIRRELLALQQSGKPVVVSMGALAASGAYWLAADADRILASPFTLTGSIGIYGMIPTFENAIAKIGITTDGVGTTDMAAAGDPTQALPPEFSRAIQIEVEEGYDRFLNIVAEGREMSLEDVEQIAEGRVWDGAKAVELGLVDELGGMADAVAAAADLAGLKEYDQVYLQHTIPPAAELFETLKRRSKDASLNALMSALSNGRLIRNLRENLNLMTFENDPASIYAHSLIPRSLVVF